MLLGTAIKPVTWVKSHATQMLKELEESKQPVIITQNGEAKAVVLSVHEFDELQESLSLLKLLAAGSADVEADRLHDAAHVLAEVDDLIAGMRDE